ncbi:MULTISPECIES: xylan 1,4-beta-xylosidase [unclassified Streptomyces]|uniref:GH39 family glycosyl hydrolase n=1 Tax=unclassified Streptomyces TaxID=2593676 RepID=UPI0007C6EBFB|nr:xylan 1,4-beta-xylosidase [Streptomyces sp. Root264]
MIRVPEEPVGRHTDAWRHCVGTGRVELALRRDYQDSLALIQRDIDFRYIRGHGLLSDGMGVHRPYDHEGARHVHHAFTYVDQVVDAYLEAGLRPFVELGFMPQDLASGPQTVFWWRGNVTPPRSYREWADLVRAVVVHLVDRYGIEEVRTWPIEVWNEPNLPDFWQGADEKAYHRLYEVTAHTVKDVDAGLQVGGPAISPGADDWLERFAEFVEHRAAPVDFVSKHAYSSGPAQHVPFGAHQTLAPASDLLAQFATPRDRLEGTRLAGLPVHITEFNSSYRPDNLIHDTAFHAAYLAPVLAHGGDLADSFSYWTFSDMFEEAGVPTALFHGGFGLLTHRQVRKPTYHLYAFMARTGADLLARGDDHLVTRHPDGRVTVLAWTPVDATGETAGTDRHELRLSLPVETRKTSGTGGFLRAEEAEETDEADGARGNLETRRNGERRAHAADRGHGAAEVQEVFVRRSSVDEERGNAYTTWRHLGSPRSPKPAQLDVLHEASEPARSHGRLPVRQGRAELNLVLARHEITLVELTPVVDEAPPWWDERRLLGRAAP